MRLRTTPWGRDDLSPQDRTEIAAGPDLLVWIGYSRGYTCRLYAERGLLPIAEAFRRESAIGAYRAAVRELPETVRWRDTDVEVVA